MVAIIFDIATEFRRYCGNDVRYVSHELKAGNWLEITFDVAGIDRRRKICAQADNGTDHAIKRAAHRIAERALVDAYQLTGKWEADKNKLLQGKTL